MTAQHRPTEGRHRNLGQHMPRHEAPILTALTWGWIDSAKRNQRAVQWDASRPVPLGVTDAWPLDGAA